MATRLLLALGFLLDTDECPGATNDVADGSNKLIYALLLVSLMLLCVTWVSQAIGDPIQWLAYYYKWFNKG